jgi:hypothetical protein
MKRAPLGVLGLKKRVLLCGVPWKVHFGGLMFY